MKKLYVFLFSLFIALIGIAQTPTLTKGETISYLDKKIKESIGHSLTNSNGYIGKVTEAQVKESAKGISIMYYFDYKTKYTYDFNPRLITGIADYQHVAGSPLNEIQIKLSGAICILSTVKPGTSGYNVTDTKSVSYANMIYLKADSTSFSKIIKALNHLRDLLKAEDDPFGNP